MNQDLADFDDYVDKYEDLLKQQLSFFSQNRDYFSEYKVRLLSHILPNKPQKILDFGCGIGLSIPHLLRYFPTSKVYATDISKKSLQYVANQYSDVIVTENPESESGGFDLIFLAGVMHHIPTNERNQTMRKLKTLLKKEGVVVIFEHNPYNPITRRMVATCPFDEGVVLISKRKMIKLMKENEVEPITASYCLFFPELLKSLRPCERFLKWLPMGGQYFAVGKRA